VLILFIFHYLITSTAKNSTTRIWWGVLLLAGLFNLILTQSFGGILLLTAGGLIYLLLSGILKLKYLAQVAMVLLLFLSITVALRFSEVKEFEPVKLRLSNWVQASRIIADNPFWGAGLGNYETKVALYTLHTEAKSIYAHNFFLQFTVETGVILPLLLLALVFPLRKKLLPTDHKSKTIYITITAVMIFYNLIDIGLYFFAAGVIFVISLSQVYPHSKREQKFDWRQELGLVVSISMFILLSSLLAVEAVSDNFRKDADFRNMRKDYINARSLYEKSIALNPFNYKAMSGIAAIPFYSGKSPGAAQESHLDRALILNPDSAFSNYLKSWYLFHKQRYWDAYFHARTAHEKNKLIHHYRLWEQHIRKNLEAGLNSQNSWETDSQGNIK
jgi:chromate transport protein ChrA